MTFIPADAWIFLAVAYSGHDAPGSSEGFYAAADHVDCAVPSHKEIDGGISRLAAAGLVSAHISGFALTSLGRQLFRKITQDNPYPRFQLEIVEEELRQFSPNRDHGKNT